MDDVPVATSGPAGRRGDGDPGALPAVPDDARDLDRDVQALDRERRSARRRARAGRLLLSRRWGPHGLSGPLVVAVLLLVGGFGAMVTLLRPSFPSQPHSRPLAAPAAAVGQRGGLLPDGPVTTPAGPSTVRALGRPAVLVLVPVPCGCDDVIGQVVDQALQVTRAVRLLSTGAQDPDGAAVSTLRSRPARGIATSGVDERGVLAGTFAASGVTLLFVAPDGVVLDVVRDVRDGRRLDAEVGRLQASEAAR